MSWANRESHSIIGETLFNRPRPYRTKQAPRHFETHRFPPWYQSVQCVVLGWEWNGSDCREGPG